MILSDRSIKEGVAAGRISITPYDESLVQPGLRSEKWQKVEKK